MPKATLEFDLENVDDKLAFDRAAAADKAICILHDLNNLLRETVRHGFFDHKQASPETISVAETLRAWLSEELHDRGLNLDNL
jgi:hypothetical protein